MLSLLLGAFFERCWWWVPSIEFFSKAVLEGMLGRKLLPGVFRTCGLGLGCARSGETGLVGTLKCVLGWLRMSRLCEAVA